MLVRSPMLINAASLSSISILKRPSTFTCKTGHTTKNSSKIFFFREFPAYTSGSFIPMGPSDLGEEIQGKGSRNTRKLQDPAENHLTWGLRNQGSLLPP